MGEKANNFSKASIQQHSCATDNLEINLVTNNLGTPPINLGGIRTKFSDRRRHDDHLAKLPKQDLLS